MNVYDKYPDRVTVDGKVYRLNLAYDRVLMALDIQSDDALTAGDKLDAQTALLLARPRKRPRDAGAQQRLLKAITELLPKSEKKSNERYIDLHQDAAMIRSAFFRVGIDLTRDKVHFCQFLELLGDLPSDTALMRVIDIRRRPLPKPTKHNADQIAALKKAKAEVAIKYSEEEARQRFADSLKNASIFRGVIPWAKTEKLYIE